MSEQKFGACELWRSEQVTSYWTRHQTSGAKSILCIRSNIVKTRGLLCVAVLVACSLTRPVLWAVVSQMASGVVSHVELGRDVHSSSVHCLFWLLLFLCQSLSLAALLMDITHYQVSSLVFGE